MSVNIKNLESINEKNLSVSFDCITNNETKDISFSVTGHIR